MKKENTLNHTLLINEGGQSGVIYKPELDSEIAALFIAAEVIEKGIDAHKAYKKTAQGAIKKEHGKIISQLSQSLKGINNLLYGLTSNYEEYQKHINTQSNATHANSSSDKKEEVSSEGNI